MEISFALGCLEMLQQESPKTPKHHKVNVLGGHQLDGHSGCRLLSHPK